MINRKFVFILIPAMLFSLMGITGCAGGPKAAKIPVATKGEPVRLYSPFRSYYIDLTPAQGLTVTGPGHGTVHRADNGESVWETDWYARTVYLSDDGIHLVRLGQEGYDQKNYRDLAIAFYDSGNLLKKYEVRDLIRHTARIQRGIKKYYWRAQQSSIEEGFSPDQKQFTMVLIDGTAYTFDLATGDIVQQQTDPGQPASRF